MNLWTIFYQVPKIKKNFVGEMAKLAVEHGADGILVSNHGARQLDGVPATVSLQTIPSKTVLQILLKFQYLKCEKKDVAELKVF